MASVLVIDDDEGVRAFLRVALECQGHAVREAADGVAGLASYRRQPADLVLCDLFMPRKDGLETIRELRDESPACNVIAMSGGFRLLPDADYLPAARRLGAAAALAKPVSPAALATAVGKALGGQMEVAP